jgi:hypothetical protein
MGTVLKCRWKIIKEYSRYIISNTGKVKSFKYSKSRILKIKHSKGGYCGVTLHENGKSRTYLLSRLVAKYFIPNPNNLPEVNHKDGIKNNNRSYNLEWCTGSYNQKHAYTVGLKSAIGSNNGQSKLTEKDVLNIKLLLLRNEMSQREIAIKFEISDTVISQIKSGAKWKHINVMRLEKKNSKRGTRHGKNKGL